jgi:hypothetical protein
MIICKSWWWVVFSENRQRWFSENCNVVFGAYGASYDLVLSENCKDGVARFLDAQRHLVFSEN